MIQLLVTAEAFDSVLIAMCSTEALSSFAAAETVTGGVPGVRRECSQAHRRLLSRSRAHPWQESCHGGSSG